VGPLNNLHKSFKLPLDGSPHIPGPRELFAILDHMPKREKTLLLIIGIATVLFGTTFIATASSLFTESVPANGGELVEGIVGTPRFINPLLATSDTDQDLTALVYSGLLRAGESEKFELDLAESYNISEDGLTYTIILKPNLKWQDGKPITSADVLFTIRLAQDSVVKSAQHANWDGIIAEAPDSLTVRFILKQPYAPFIQNLTMGILPEHLWKSVKPGEFAFSTSNIQAVGSGPYKISKVNKDGAGIPTSIELVPYKDFALGRAFISKVILRFYPDEQALLSAYKRGEVVSVSGLSTQAGQDLTRVGKQVLGLPLPRVFGVFFNTTGAGPLNDNAVREALSLVVDRQSIVGVALQGFGTPTDSPIGTPGLSHTDGSDSTTRLAKAISLLEAGGWKVGTDGIRANKKGKSLTFTLVTSDSPQLSKTAAYLDGVWTPIGVRVDTQVYEESDLISQIILPRKFDALLYGEIVGRIPDPYAFWHSSQRNDRGLNIGGYASLPANKILQEARAAVNDTLREEKYREFEDLLAEDVPAVLLYSPDYLYLPNPKISAVTNMKIGNPSDRFLNIYKWYVSEDRVWNIFAN